MDDPMADLDRVLALLRADSPAVSVLAVADQLEAFARDEPDDLIAGASVTVARAAVAAADSSDRGAWDRLANATRVLRFVAEAVSDTRRPL